MVNAMEATPKPTLEPKKPMQTDETPILGENKENNLEITAHHLTCAIKEFDSFLGKTSTDDVLESVFSNFCVGK